LVSLFRSVGPLAAATFATGTQTYVFSGLLADLAKDLNVSIGAAGQLATAFAITFALTAPMMGGLLGNRERRSILVLALSAVALINMAAAFAPDYGSLLGLRIIAGLAATCVNPVAAAAAIALVSVDQRGRALALVTAGLTVAFMMGIPMGSAIGGYFGWRATFLFAASLAACAALFVRVTLPVIQPVPRPSRVILDELRRPAILPSLLATFLGFAATFTVTAYLGPLITAVTGATGATVGAYQACIGVGSLIGVPLGGLLVDRGRSRLALTMAFALMTVVLMLYSALLHIDFAARAPVLLGAVILAGAAALFTMVPAIQARLVEAAPDATPLILGLNGSIIFLGQGAGALTGGLVTDRIAFSDIGYAGAVIAALGLCLAFTWPAATPSKTRS
jgi:MFS transporter, DHA1 family, inner membrane transport protein